MKTNHRLRAKNVVIMMDKHSSQHPITVLTAGWGCPALCQALPRTSPPLAPGKLQGDFNVQLMSKPGPM